jgi:hypothetical protein
LETQTHLKTSKDQTANATKLLIGKTNVQTAQMDNLLIMEILNALLQPKTILASVMRSEETSIIATGADNANKVLAQMLLELDVLLTKLLFNQ